MTVVPEEAVERERRVPVEAVFQLAYWSAVVALRLRADVLLLASAA